MAAPARLTARLPLMRARPEPAHGAPGLATGGRGAGLACRLDRRQGCRGPFRSYRVTGLTALAVGLLQQISAGFPSRSAGVRATLRIRGLLLAAGVAGRAVGR